MNNRELIEQELDAAYALGVAQERAACKKICDEISEQAHRNWKLYYKTYDQGVEAGAEDCAEAIRTRSAT